MSKSLTQPITQQKTITLSRGQLSLDYQTTGDYSLEDLLGFAERINPKRAFLFVSKVLGRHIPVSPATMRNAFTALANTVPSGLPEPILVVGMAETAVGLSAGVHQVLQQRYPKAILLNSTRHAQTAPLLTTFSEDHSHASQHLMYQSEDVKLQQQVCKTKTLIMIDDEASTGQTCQNVVNALRHSGLYQLEQVHLATLVDWSLGQVTSHPFDTLAFYRHHLLSGRWQWQDSPNPPAVTMPNVATTATGSQALIDTGNWGRLPTLDSSLGLPSLLAGLQRQLEQKALTIDQLVQKNVLVLGSNEFVWLPFLLAERLAGEGVATQFSALTRSPIAVQADSAVTTVLKFQDNYGLGMTNFVYNVVPSNWDYVLLCIETAIDSVDKSWQTFDNVLIVSPIAQIAQVD